MDKTYAEVSGAQPFDWRKALIDADDNGLTKRQWEDLSEWSAGWPTCACGNQCAILERDMNGQPLDMELRNSGLNFYAAIEEGNYKDALLILDRIEARAAVLVKEELAKLNHAR